MERKKKTGIFEISVLHGTWLALMMQSDEYKKFIEEYHKNSPNTIFNHKSLSDQLQLNLVEQMNNNEKDQKDAD